MKRDELVVLKHADGKPKPMKDLVDGQSYEGHVSNLGEFWLLCVPRPRDLKIALVRSKRNSKIVHERDRASELVRLAMGARASAPQFRHVRQEQDSVAPVSKWVSGGIAVAQYASGGFCPTHVERVGCALRCRRVPSPTDHGIASGKFQASV